jgi:hypothetical protein
MVVMMTMIMLLLLLLLAVRLGLCGSCHYLKRCEQAQLNLLLTRDTAEISTVVYHIVLIIVLSFMLGCSAGSTIPSTTRTCPQQRHHS